MGSAQARRFIHDNDVERLKQLLAEHPALLSWHANDDDGGLLGMATGAYGDSFDPDRERVFTHAACAELLIDRIDRSTSRTPHRADRGRCFSGSRSSAVHDGDLTAFVRWLQREPWLLGEDYVGFQAELIGQATLNDRGEFIIALLDLDPALRRRQPPPQSQATVCAHLAKTHLIPVISRIWPLPENLPHAAGMGDLSRVTYWFDESGPPALGDLDHRGGGTAELDEHAQSTCLSTSRKSSTILGGIPLREHDEKLPWGCGKLSRS